MGSVNGVRKWDDPQGFTLSVSPGD